MESLERDAADAHSASIEVGPSTANAGEVVRRSLEESVVRLDDAIPVIEAGDDMEGVHQARVATRRLRSDLGAFRALWDIAWAHELGREIGWFGKVLGAARDADILRARFQGHAAGWSVSERSKLRSMMDTIGREDDQANDQLRAVIHGERAGALVDRLRVAASRPAFTDQAGLHSSTLVVGVREVAAEFEHAVARAEATPTDELLHRVRIAAKHVRYPAETIVSVTPAAGPVALAAEGTQELLGQHHDAVVAERWLLRFGALDLAARERSDADEIRVAWPETARAVNEAAIGLAG
jgi:CHAD domain-containing protein